MLRNPTKTFVRYIVTEPKRLRLEGKVAIVTASTNGIGYSIAECFAENGAKVLISSRKKENVEKSVLALKEKGFDVRGMVCHVGKSADRKNLVEKALNDFGKIDIFVSNAAVNPVACPLLDTPEEAWDKIFDLNLKSSFLLAKEAVPHLSKTRGSMLFVSSVAGFMPMPLLGAYSISKTALLSLVKVLSAECALKGVRINGLAPGVIKTDFSSFLTNSDQISASFLEQTPMRRFGEPAECAGAAVFLSSDDASYITGETIVIGGGYNCRL
nr:short-chain dehydrogenase/reductase SDRA [Hydra vulgaris]